MPGSDNINGSARIDGKTIKIRPGLTVLDAARQADIYIPTLCYLENLTPYGGCRLCIVEIKNMKGFPTACTTPIEPGMEIRTKTRELQKLRSEILEFTLSEHPYTCLVCKDKMECTEFMRTTRKVGTITGCNFCTSNGDCELQDLVEYLDLKDIKYPISYRGLPPEKNNPFYDLDYNLCILCGRCVRICNEERNSNVLAFVERGNTTIVGTAFNESQKDAGCEFCGACVDVCPTGSISEKLGKWTGLPDKSVETSCVLCSVGCSMNVNARNNAVINVGPKPGKRINPPQLCLRGKFIPPDISNHPSRITAPLIKRKNKWIEVSWNEAIEYTASNLERYRGNQFGLLGSGQDTIEDNYSLQKFSRKVMRSNNIDLYSSYPDKQILNTIYQHYSQHAPPSINDIEKSDTLFVIGSDASISHPLAEHKIRRAFINGKNIIYANNLSTRTSTFVTHEVHYSPGEEVNFLYAIVAGLVMKMNSRLSESITKQFKNADIQKALKLSAISHSESEKIISALEKSKNLLIIASDELLRNSWAMDSVNSLLNLSYLKSTESRCNIMFLGYEGSLTGGTLSGMHPDYLPGFQPLAEEKIRQKWNKNWNAKISSIKGSSGNEMVKQVREDGITALFITGNIPPHPNLGNLKFLVQCNMFRTGLSEYANVFFPISNFFENEGHILTLEGKLKKVKRVTSTPGGVRSITRIISDLASAMQEYGFDNYKPQDLFKELSSYTEIPSPKTKTTKPEFHYLKVRIRKVNAEYPIKLIIEHNHFKYRGNSLTHLVDDLKQVVDENVLYLSPILMKRRKLKEGEQVKVLAEMGESTYTIKNLHELPDQTAFLRPNGMDSLNLTQEVYLNNNILPVRIEKVKDV
ncbi:MAG: molybdopterin-dependent oxidoreductase [Bacteroidales bacterium]|nr:molybdopterin-dependent oxidoreductase [Bacteroidales bacterium]